jgi:molybdenum cofactor guanylyltransferase
MGMGIHQNIAAVVLAGGGGRRMFPESAAGGDKALVPLGGKPLIAHIVESLSGQTRHIIVNANAHADRFAFLGLHVVPDAKPDQGPLAGLLAAMDWTLRSAATSTAIVSVSTDTPFLPPDLVIRLVAAANVGGPAIAASLDRLHPVIGLWPLTLRDALAQSLREQRRSVESFAKRHDAIAVPFALRTMGARTVDPFFNANTPDDLAYAEAVLAG